LSLAWCVGAVGTQKNFLFAGNPCFSAAQSAERFTMDSSQGNVYGDRIGTYSTVSVPAQPKEPRVRQKVAELGASLELLEKSLIELGNKLSDVMTPEDTKSTTADPLPHELCVMADQLQSQIRRAEYLRSMIDSYISRLEV
jgi:hypothetical protein